MVVDFALRFEGQPLLEPDRIGAEGAGPYSPAIAGIRKERGQ